MCAIININCQHNAYLERIIMSITDSFRALYIATYGLMHFIAIAIATANNQERVNHEFLILNKTIIIISPNTIIIIPPVELIHVGEYSGISSTKGRSGRL